MVKKGFSLLLAVLMLLSVFSFASAEEETEYRDTIYWLINTDQDTLDPQNNVNNSKVIPQFYSGLLKLNLEGQYELDIATGYEVSEDGLTWTFTPARRRVFPFRKALHGVRLRVDLRSPARRGKSAALHAGLQ